MPRMDGYQFYSQVRARPDWVSVPFIFLTAKSEKADVRRGKILGADDYITKPFEEADLLVAVQAKLNRRAQLDAAHGRQVADLKRTILTTLNHEFRTPLTYITTYADMLGDSQHQHRRIQGIYARHPGRQRPAAAAGGRFYYAGGAANRRGAADL